MSFSDPCQLTVPPGGSESICILCKNNGSVPSPHGRYWEDCPICTKPKQSGGTAGGIPGGIPHNSPPPGEKHREFLTGAKRDNNSDKLRFDLLPVCALERWAKRVTEGAKKYGERNWEKGMPLSVYYESLLRHVFQWRKGDKSEDHLAAVLFNAAAIIYTEEKIESGELPQELKR